MNLSDWTDRLARMLAKARNHGSVRMVGHNPLPSEYKEAERFIIDFLDVYGKQAP